MADRQRMRTITPKCLQALVAQYFLFFIAVRTCRHIFITWNFHVRYSDHTEVFQQLKNIEYVRNNKLVSKKKDSSKS